MRLYCPSIASPDDVWRGCFWFMALPCIENFPVRIKKCFTIERTAGINSKNPKVSVTKPGVQSMIPAQMRQRPSSISWIGNMPLRMFCWLFIKVAKPCLRTRYPPIIAVITQSNNVFKTPISSPAAAKAATSAIGIIRNRTKNSMIKFF